MMHHMKIHKVPTDLQKRVRLWYDYTYSRLVFFVEIRNSIIIMRIYNAPESNMGLIFLVILFSSLYSRVLSTAVVVLKYISILLDLIYLDVRSSQSL